MRSDLDMRAYLSPRVTPFATYNDGQEWVLQCRCDLARKVDTAHLYVNVRKGVGLCHRCGERYNPVEIVRLIEDCSFLEAVVRIKELDAPTHARLSRVLSALESGDETPSGEAPAEICLPREFIPCRRDRVVPRYLTDVRKIRSKDCYFYCLGWCDHGFYADRVVVPVFDLEGELASFVARYMGNPPRKVPKVLYPKGSRTSQVLFNHDVARRYSTVVVCEGVFDAISVGRNAVAIFGKVASQEQKSQLAVLGQDRRIVVMLDSDAQEEAHDLAEHLAEACSDVRVAKIPSGRGDPGDCSRAEVKSAVRDAAVVNRQNSVVRVLAWLCE